jgi:SET domain-containing protein
MLVWFFMEYIKTKYPNVKVKRSGHGGLGLFAEELIEKNRDIIEYVGEIITAKEADESKGKYLFELNSKFTLDGKSRTNIARYINHSCLPNAEADVIKMKIIISAKRTILSSEEITYDYGKEYFDEFIKPHGCKCGFCDGQGKIRSKK